MASFSEELRTATAGLQAFNRALAMVRSMPGGGGGGSGGAASIVGGLSGGGGFVGASGAAGLAMGVAGMGLGLVNAGARALTPAANAYAVTGTSAGFAAGVTNSLLGAVEGTGIGGLLLGATGISAARGTNQRAGDATSDITSSLAAIGVDVSDKDRQEIFDINQTIQKRVTTEKGKVQAIADSAKELNDAKPVGGVPGFDTLVSVVSSIEALLRKVVG